MTQSSDAPEYPRLEDCPRTKALGLPHTRPDQYGEVVPATKFWELLNHACLLEQELQAATPNTTKD